MLEQFLALVDGSKSTVILILIVVDLLAGIIVALKEGTFQFNKLANFLNTTVLCCVAGYYILGLIVMTHREFATLLLAAYGLLDVSLLAGIWAKLGKLFPGLPVPKVI